MDEIISRRSTQSDDPVRQAVDALPGDFSVGLWYNLLAKSITTRAEKMNDFIKPLFDTNSVCPKCESTLSLKRIKEGLFKIKCSKCRFKYYPRPDQLSPDLQFAAVKKDILIFLGGIPKNAEIKKLQADEKPQKPEEHPLSEPEDQ